MNKLYDYFINKVFTVPYIDKMISGKKLNLEESAGKMNHWFMSG